MKYKWLVYVLILIIDGLRPALGESSGTGHCSKCSRNFDEGYTAPDSTKALLLKNTGNSAIPKKVVFSHSTYEDFSGGTVSNSGQNLFVSGEGQIRFINWFDLNTDGYPEIVAVNDHDHYETTDGFVYYNIPGRGFKSLMPPVPELTPGFQILKWMEESSGTIGRLPSVGGGRTLVADLNRDGYPEILFTNFVHGWSSNHFPVYLYWGGEKGYSNTRLSYLPTLTASGLAAADLNSDGRMDIVVANAGREYIAQMNAGNNAGVFMGKNRTSGKIDPEEGTSYIYWQQPFGFSVDKRSEIPTKYALDGEIADMNADGYPDVVFLQGGNPGSIRIFYGKIGGIDITKFIDLKALAPVYSDISKKICIADLDHNGWPDIFVPSDGDSSEIFWNSPKGPDQIKTERIPARNAVTAAARDLNHDGYNDLVVVNHIGDSFIYWGSGNGFSVKNLTSLPTNGATGVAIADLDNNGFNDIAFSNSLKGKSFDTPSYIYWGSTEGYHPADRDDLWGFGAVDIAVGDFDRNGLHDLFLMNRQSGTSAPQFGPETYSSADMFIYWGNPRSRYSTASLAKLPGATPQSSVTASDMDGNGYADMVYTTNGGKTLNIFYSDAGGFSSENHIQFDIPFVSNDVLAADLDRDGYLDIIVGSKSSNQFMVFPGKKTGFENPEIFDFGMPEFSAALGDIDGDGKLDLVLGEHGFIKIINGTTNGFFKSDRTQTLRTGMFTRRISLADFNKDGALDIFGHHFSKADSLWENNTFSAIYWNRDGSFSPDNRLKLPSHGAHCGSVADVNHDGNTDILIANYNSQYSRNLETFVYWGASGGSFSPDSVTGLPGYSPVANMVLDLNGDGYNDIVAFNHSKSDQYAGLNPMGGIHSAGSFIYWGSEKGWNLKNRDMIPSIGPHNRLTAEPGDVMQRRPFEEYTSMPVNAGLVKGKYTIKVGSNHNFRQNITLFIKESGNQTGLEKKSWQEIPLTERSDDFFLYEGKLKGSTTWFQYKLRLDTGGTGTGPVIESVEMSVQ